MLISTRKCWRCKQTKELTDFPRHKNCKDGRAYICKPCNNDLTKQRYHSDSEYRKKLRDAAHKTWQLSKTDPIIRERLRVNDNKSQRNYRHKNKKKFNEFQKTAKLLKKSGLREVLWERAKGKCEMCGEKLFRTRKRSNCAFHHLDSDRYNNSLENLILVCTKCHLHKIHRSPRKFS